MKWSLLFALSATEVYALNAFYLNTDCGGMMRYIFQRAADGVCIRARTFHRSLYSDELRGPEFLSVFKPDSTHAECGKVLCILASTDTCCSGNRQRIKGAMFYSLPHVLGAPCNSTTSVDLFAGGSWMKVLDLQNKVVQVPNEKGRSPSRDEIFGALLSSGMSNEQAKSVPMKLGC